MNGGASRSVKYATQASAPNSQHGMVARVIVAVPSMRNAVLATLIPFEAAKVMQAYSIDATSYWSNRSRGLARINMPFNKSATFSMV